MRLFVLVRRTKQGEVSLYFYTHSHKGYKIDTKVVLKKRATTRIFAISFLTLNVTKSIPSTHY